MTGRFSSGSPPKKRHHELLGADLVEPRFNPLRDPLRLLHGHLRGELVVVAVVALEAVVACEVALEGREDRDAQLIGILAHRGEVLVQRLRLLLALADDEAVLDEGFDRLLLLRVERALSVLDPVEQTGHVGRDEKLRIGEGVHQEHLVALRQGHPHIEDRRLHKALFRFARASAAR
jgi:hypothetical protein